jgi:hypothetical protein
MAVLTRLLPLALALAGCGGEAPVPIAYVVPADGQTAVPAELPLFVYAPDLTLPEDWPGGAWIRVVDLDRGGFVEGEVDRDGPAWTFTPRGGWRAGTRYGWTLDLPVAQAHGPQFDGGEVEGVAVFDTRPEPVALAAATDDDGSLCLVFSAPVDRAALTDARLAVDDELVDEPRLAALDEGLWDPDLPERPPGDPGVSVACAAGAPSGALARVWLGARGPWLVEISPESPAVVVAELHRRRP